MSEPNTETKAPRCVRCSSLTSGPEACDVCSIARGLTRAERKALREPNEAYPPTLARLASRDLVAVEYVDDGCTDYRAHRTARGERVLAALSPGRPRRVVDGKQRTIWLPEGMIVWLEVEAERMGCGWSDIVRGILEAHRKGADGGE